MEFLQHLINGISLGGVYGLIALGYTLVFGILRLINFAHGDVFMLGAYFGMYWAQSHGFSENPSFWNLLSTLIAAMAGCALVGVAIERIAYRPLRKSPRIYCLITAVGISMAIEFSAQLYFGSAPKYFPDLYQPTPYWEVGGIQIQSLAAGVIAISAVLVVALQWIVFRTRFGRAMRAVSFNADVAALQGIPTDRIVSLTFGLGSALAGAAGVFTGLIYHKIDPFMGVMPGLKAFVAAVLGGIGNVAGAVLGGLILGVSESLLSGYGASSFRDAVAFAILILILLFKPSGLLGRPTQEKV